MPAFISDLSLVKACLKWLIQSVGSPISPTSRVWVGGSQSARFGGFSAPPQKCNDFARPFDATSYDHIFLGHWVPMVSAQNISQPLHLCNKYADQLTPLAPPQLIRIYGSPMECLGMNGWTLYRPFHVSEVHLASPKLASPGAFPPARRACLSSQGAGQCHAKAGDRSVVESNIWRNAGGCRLQVELAT